MRTGNVGMAVVVTMVAALAVVASGAEEKPQKPVIPCDKIVETYKLNKSVDETSDALLVDESRVMECLKAAGISAPAQDAN
jgi:hypothetical protein